MRMTIVALRRPLADRMAIHAARMLEDPTSLDKQRAGAFRRIGKRRKRVGPAQILGAGKRCGRGRQNDDDQTCFHRDSLATSKADRRQSALWVAATHRSCRRRHAFKNRVACSTKSSGYWWCAP